MAETVEVLLTEFRADIKRYEAALRRQIRITETATRQNERSFRRANRQIVESTDSMSRDVRRAIAAIAVGVAGREVANYADAWTEAGNKIAAAGTPLEKQSERLKELAATAIDTRSSFEATTALYARLGIATENLTGKNYDLLRITELINKATVAGGASTSERNSTVLQLSQALASGQLMGEELRSLRENAPLLLRAIADEMGATIGELKELGAQGEITSERILAGILKAADGIEARFGVTNVTIGDSFDILKTRLIEFIGQSDDSAQATENISKAIIFVADNVDALAEAMIVAGAAITGALGAQAAIAVVSSLNSIAVGATATSRAMALLRAASAFMFGPAGLIIGAAALAGGLAYLAINANKVAIATEDYRNSSTGLNSAIDTYIEAQAAANELSGTAKENAEAQAQAAREEAEATLQAAEAKIADARAIIQRMRAREAEALAATRFSKDALQLRPVQVGRDAQSEIQQQLANIQEVVDQVARAREVLAQNPLEIGVGVAGQSVDAPASGGGRDTAGEIAALEEIASAHRKLFETEREQVARIRDERLKAIDDAKLGEAEAAALRSKANEVYQQEIANIRAAEMEASNDYWDALDAREQRELDMLTTLTNARDEMAGRAIGIVERELEAKRAAIEAEIEDEARKAEALALLEEQTALERQRIRDEVLGRGMSSDDEVERLRAAEELKLEALREALELEYITLEEHAARKLELEQATEDQIMAIRTASMQMQLGNGEKLFNGLAGMAAAFGGKQSGLYKAMFAVEKAFATASALVSIQQGMAKALSLPFPANIGAFAQVAALGATVMGNIASVSANFRDGGIDIRGSGSGRSDGIPAMISRGESVITAAGTRANPNLLEAINAGQNVEGQIAAARPGRSISVGGMTLVVEGDIATQAAFDRLQAQIDAANARQADEVSRIVEADRVRTVPRHLR